jgi:hypothetical protein
VEARLIAYASGKVLAALAKTQGPADRFDAAFRAWLTDNVQSQLAKPPPPGAGRLTAQRIDDQVKAAKGSTHRSNHAV